MTPEIVLLCVFVALASSAFTSLFWGYVVFYSVDDPDE